MKWKGRRQSKNVEFDEEYGKNYGRENPDKSVYRLPDKIDKENIKERIKRDIVRGRIPNYDEHYDIDGNPYWGPTPDHQKEARKLDDIHKKGKTPTPTPKPKKQTHSAQVTPGKWNTNTK